MQLLSMRSVEWNIQREHQHEQMYSLNFFFISRGKLILTVVLCWSYRFLLKNSQINMKVMSMSRLHLYLEEMLDKNIVLNKNKNVKLDFFLVENTII